MIPAPVITDCLHATLAQSGEGDSWGIMEPALLVIAVLLITASLFAGIRRRKNDTGTRLPAREQLERLKQQRGVQNDLESLMVEIEQLAKRVGAQLDAKTIALEKLTDEADRKIEQLRRLLDRQANATSGATSQQTKAASANAPDEPSQAAASLVPSDKTIHRVCELADQGRTPVQIAEQLDEQVGRVELILALRRETGDQVR